MALVHSQTRRHMIKHASKWHCKLCPHGPGSWIGLWWIFKLAFLQIVMPQKVHTCNCGSVLCLTYLLKLVHHEIWHIVYWNCVYTSCNGMWMCLEVPFQVWCLREITYITCATINPSWIETYNRNPSKGSFQSISFKLWCILLIYATNTFVTKPQRQLKTV